MTVWLRSVFPKASLQLSIAFSFSFISFVLRLLQLLTISLSYMANEESTRKLNRCAKEHLSFVKRLVLVFKQQLKIVCPVDITLECRIYGLLHFIITFLKGYSFFIWTLWFLNCDVLYIWKHFDDFLCTMAVLVMKFIG